MMKVATLVLEKTCLPADELQAVFLIQSKWEDMLCFDNYSSLNIRQNTHTHIQLFGRKINDQPESFPLNTAAGQDNIRGLRE